MSSEIAITCNGVGKSFQLYNKRNDQLYQSLFGRWKQFYHPHWVLRDINFEVKRGETWGIIGRNGTGKTTLLRLICGIGVPTYGEIKVKGRIAPILALGAGFDHDLTGRENAMIGGAILGLKRKSILAKLDSIAAFADIGEFFNQPLRMYSSGMQARLAFAVCVHAEADILIVDEALSVGDATFTKKCDDYIRHFSSSGTILVVSHDLSALEEMCDHVIWIDEGRVAACGRPEDVIPAYRRAFNITRLITAPRLVV